MFVTGTRIPNDVLAHSVTTPRGLIIQKLRLVKNNRAMLMQHRQATISPGHSERTLLPGETLLLLWQLHPWLFKLPARPSPQAKPLLQDPHTGTGSWRGQDRNGGTAQSFSQLCFSQHSSSAAAQGYANVAIAAQSAPRASQRRGGPDTASLWKWKKRRKLTQKTEWKARARGSNRHTPHTSRPTAGRV